MGCIPQRYVLAVLAFFGFFMTYSLRVNLSIVILNMASEYEWSKTTQGALLGSFFYGYVFTNVPGGLLATKYGGKFVFGMSVLLTTALTFLTPVVASNLPLMFTVNILKGLCEGVAYPSMSAIWSRWAPPQERTILVASVYSGSYWGTIVSLPVCGWLAGTTISGWPTVFQGWRLAFMVGGAVSLVWCIFWFVLMYNSPEDHPWISPAERDFILRSLSNEKTGGNNVNENETSPPPRIRQSKTPWRGMLTSIPVWSLIVAAALDSVGFSLLFSCTPTYLKDVFNYELQQNGFLSALPWLAMGLSQPPASIFADWLTKHKVVPLKIHRQAMMTFGKIIQVGGMLLTAFCGAPEWGVTGLIMVAAANGLCGTVINVNAIDIAPAHAGVLMGIENTFATLSSIAVPQFAESLTPQGTLGQWRIVFLVSAGCYVVEQVIFMMFVDFYVQPWAVDDDDQYLLTESKDISDISRNNKRVLTSP